MSILYCSHGSTKQSWQNSTNLDKFEQIGETFATFHQLDQVCKILPTFHQLDHIAGGNILKTKNFSVHGGFKLKGGSKPPFSEFVFFPKNPRIRKWWFTYSMGDLPEKRLKFFQWVRARTSACAQQAHFVLHLRALDPRKNRFKLQALAGYVLEGVGTPLILKPHSREICF